MKKVPCEVFCRIVGYYRPLSNWNAGKMEEYRERIFFKTKQEHATKEYDAVTLTQVRI